MDTHEEDLLNVLAAFWLHATVVPLTDTSDHELARAQRLGASMVLKGAMATRLPQRSTAPGELPRWVERPAYIIATSGSTSAPKDVAIGDAQLRTLLLAGFGSSRLSRGDRAASNYRCTFDPYFWVLLCWLRARCVLVLPHARENLLLDTFVEGREISWWRSVPSLGELALRARRPRPGSLSSLRYACFGGEVLRRDLVETWRSIAPRAVVANSYGPSETTITVGAREFTPTDELPRGRMSVPIGNFHDGVEWMLAPVPGGARLERELCLRGAQRFDGYLQDSLNRDKFLLADGQPASASRVVFPVDPSWWFRTGDVVTLDEGDMYFDRRTDAVVKVEGHRVDLEQVEAAALAEPWVGDAHAFISDDRVVCAVETTTEVAVVDWTTLRPYARPRHTVAMTTFPRLLSGKRDVVRIQAAVLARLAGESGG